MTNQYRIDYATSTVYELNIAMDAYTYLCSFRQIGAERKNRESTIVKKIEAWIDGQ